MGEHGDELKVAKEASGGNGSSLEPIVIPPPRPKRKPTHPYPRKLGDQTSRSVSPSERDNGSPTSVLSTVGSSDSHSPNRSLSPVSSASPPPAPPLATTEEELETLVADKSKNLSTKLELFPIEPTKQSLKLFGKTVLVSDSGMSSYCKSPIIQPLPRKLSRSETFPMVIINPQEKLLSCWIHQQVPSKQEEVENRCSDSEKAVQNEGSSSTGSNTGSVDDTGHTDKSGSEPAETMVCRWELKPSERSAFSELRRTNSESNSRGFGPYKKRKMVIETEEEEQEQIRLCL